MWTSHYDIGKQLNFLEKVSYPVTVVFKMLFSFSQINQHEEKAGVRGH